MRRRLSIVAILLAWASMTCGVQAQSLGDLLGGIARGATGLPIPSTGGPSAEPSSKTKRGGTSGEPVYVCNKPVGEGNAHFAAKEGMLTGLAGGFGGVAARKDQEAKHCYNAALTSGLSNCKDIGYGCSECRASAGGKSVYVVRSSGGALGRCP